jgi:lipopolysaccharide transport system ATP-binding protein
MSDIAISVTNVSKCYRVFDDQRSRLLRTIWPGYNKGMKEVWALKEINFQIKRGESVAIIGRNGGGKSTLLEILTGTLTPTTGSVKVNGRVSALLELGSGFNPEYSGRDNVILNGMLLGLNKKEILSRFEEIEAFAEIGDAIDRPVKTYSSGMMMRLAFAVQVLCDPDILIIDEALSVGDFFFQQKCLNFIRELRNQGVTLIFVSHDMGTVRDICERALYLYEGEVQADDNATLVISIFLSKTNPIEHVKLTNPNKSHNSPLLRNLDINDPLSVNASLWRNNDETIDKVGKLISIDIYDEDRFPNTSFKIGDFAIIQITYLSDLNHNCHTGLSIRNKFGEIVTATGTYFCDTKIPNSNKSSNKLHVVVSELKIQLMIESGQYSLDIASGMILSPNRSQLLDSINNIGPINIYWNYEIDKAPFLGQFGMNVDSKCYLKKQ